MHSPDTASPVTGSLWPLRTNELTFEAGGKRLVDRLSLVLGAHAITVVMGANGAGKSLLLRLLHGLIKPTSGSIAWNGEAMNDAIRLRQAMVFQRPVLLRRSVAANIDWVLGLRPARAGASVSRDELLARVGLLERARQPARLLSGGEQQRLALARAMAHQPEVLFLDEPTASLDPASTAQIEAIVRAVATQGTRMVFVTHDIGQAKRLADDIVFMHCGRLAEAARARIFFDQPASEAARAYLDGRLFI